MALPVIMGFLEGSIDGEKKFGGTVFPKTLGASAASESGVDDLVATVERERDSLADMLRAHGAVLIRGFGVRSAEEFDRVVGSLGWEATKHIGAVNRIRMTDRVYTANESPVDQLIYFHHEMLLWKQPASKIIFFCSEPAPEGGETSIVLSNVVVQKMEERLPQVMKKLSEVGLIFRSSTAKDTETDSGSVVNKTWKWVFKTDDEAEAEKRAKEIMDCDSVNFNKDGSAEFVFGPTNPIREFGGKRAWFMPLLGYTGNIYDVKHSFGDGSEITMEIMTTYRDILEENCVDVKWQKGDILLVDNHAVQHARRPGKPPRVVLVSMCN